MKNYTAKIENWSVSKILIYFSNFIKNHNANINDDDVFDVLVNNIHGMDWEQFIRKNFSKTAVSKMEKGRNCRSCLDFSDSPQDMLCAVWNFTFARKTLKKNIIILIDEYLAVHPLEKYEK